MTSPKDVPRFHAEFDRFPDDRVRLFEALYDYTPNAKRVLYPGCFVDIGPSVWFDDVTYVDIDKRTPRFFGQESAVTELVVEKRNAAGRTDGGEPTVTFHHCDYADELPIEDNSVDLLISLYAGFISEHNARYVRPGGLIMANNSHGDASMAALSPENRLVAVVLHRDGKYRVERDDVETFMVPKRGEQPTAEELRSTNRGVAFTKPAFAYIFERGVTPES